MRPEKFRGLPVHVGVGENLRGAPLRGDGPEGVGVDEGDLVGQRDAAGGDTQPCESSGGVSPSEDF